MTQKQIKDMIAKWQKRLGLEAWDIAVKFEDGPVYARDNRSLRTVHRSTYYKRATMAISSDAMDIEKMSNCIESDLVKTGTVTAEEQAEAGVVHELLHLYTRDMMETTDLVRDQLSKPALSVWDGAWTRAEEEFVEALALALVRNWV